MIPVLYQYLKDLGMAIDSFSLTSFSLDIDENPMSVTAMKIPVAIIRVGILHFS